MRIIGGKFRGHRLTAPKGQVTRPTTDRTREALFNILTHADFLEGIENINILDVFCGSGALGLEALSRGAGSAVFIDQNTRGAQTNWQALKKPGSAEFIAGDATRLGKKPDKLPAADLVFLDPPYGQELGEKALRRLASGGWLKPDARIVFEMSAKKPESFPEGFDILHDRHYGDTRLLFLKFTD